MCSCKFLRNIFLTKNVILLSFSLPFSDAKAKSRNTLSYNPFWEFKWIKSSGRIAFFKIIHLFYPSSNSFPWFIYGFYSFVSVLSVLSRATLKMGQPLVSLYRCFNLFFFFIFFSFHFFGFLNESCKTLPVFSFFLLFGKLAMCFRNGYKIMVSLLFKFPHHCIQDSVHSYLLLRKLWHLSYMVLEILTNSVIVSPMNHHVNSENAPQAPEVLTFEPHWPLNNEWYYITLSPLEGCSGKSLYNSTVLT